MDTFAKRLRHVRKLRGHSQDELSEKSGVAQPVISKIERGLILQTRGLIALAMALKCSPYWLEFGRGEMEDSALTELVETIRRQDEAQDGWPFDLAGLTRERYESLPLPSRYAVQAAMMVAIEKQEAEVSRAKQEATQAASRAA